MLNQITVGTISMDVNDKIYKSIHLYFLRIVYSFNNKHTYVFNIQNKGTKQNSNIRYHNFLCKTLYYDKYGNRNFIKNKMYNIHIQRIVFILMKRRNMQCIFVPFPKSFKTQYGHLKWKKNFFLKYEDFYFIISFWTVIKSDLMFALNFLCSHRCTRAYSKSKP